MILLVLTSHWFIIRSCYFLYFGVLRSLLRVFRNSLDVEFWHYYSLYWSFVRHFALHLVNYKSSTYPAVTLYTAIGKFSSDPPIQPTLFNHNSCNVFNQLLFRHYRSRHLQLDFPIPGFISRLKLLFRMSLKTETNLDSKS